MLTFKQLFPSTGAGFCKFEAGLLLDKMSLFQSALDFLAGPGSSGAASRDQNDFVGQVVELGDMKLRIKRVIAEGEVLYEDEKY